MPVKITVLVENSQGEHLALKNEHGLSFHIDKDGRKVLFDTGQSGVFLDNARQLKVDPCDIEFVVLSHGHYDHSGGLKHLLDLRSGFRLVVGRGFFEDKYADRGNAYEFIGNAFGRQYLEDKGVAVEVMDSKHREVLPGVHVLTGFPRRHKDEIVNPRFKLFKDGEFVPDLFDDEVLVAVESSKGLIVVLGCSHPGVKNMLDFVAEILGKPIYAVIGGTHLVEASDPGLDRTVQYFKEKDVKIIGVSHCTGQKATENLGTCFNDRFFHNRTGSCLFIE